MYHSPSREEKELAILIDYLLIAFLAAIVHVYV